MHCGLAVIRAQGDAAGITAECEAHDYATLGHVTGDGPGEGVGTPSSQAGRCAWEKVGSWGRGAWKRRGASVYCVERRRADIRSFEWDSWIIGSHSDFDGGHAYAVLLHARGASDGGGGELQLTWQLPQLSRCVCAVHHQQHRKEHCRGCVATALS